MSDGTVYHSTKYDTKLEHDPERGMISVTKAGSGHYVFLSEHDLRELAFEILEAQFKVTYVINGDQEIHLTKKVPPRPLPRVGEFYRVISAPGMAPGFQHNPIARVESVSPQGFGFFLRLADGKGSRWHAMGQLEGPLDVREVVSWVVK